MTQPSTRGVAILGVSRPDAGEVSVYGMHPRRAIGHGLVSAVLQTGGLLKDLTVGEAVACTASLFPSSPPSAGGAEPGRDRRDRRPEGRQVLGR